MAHLDITSGKEGRLRVLKTSIPRAAVTASSLFAFLLIVGCGPKFKAAQSEVNQQASLYSYPELNDTKAEEYSRRIREKFMPFGTLVHPVFASSDSDEILGYTHGADAAIWTGHYLAAEAFRFKVSQSAEALDNVRFALKSIKQLVDITGTDVLARTIVFADDPKGQWILDEEKDSGIYDAELVDDDTGERRAVKWVGHTSRDQYAGVFFGLSATYQLIDNTEIREKVRSLVERMLDKLIRDVWMVVMPGESTSLVTFETHQYQIMGLLQIGTMVNRGKYRQYYLDKFDPFAFWSMMRFEGTDNHSSYYKFNLAYNHVFSLIGLEKDRIMRYFLGFGLRMLMSATNGHQNAHFNMIQRAVLGSDSKRDEETRRLLSEWLQRPDRNFTVDNTEFVRICQSRKGDDIACDPIPVAQRPFTDFLWQRSPYTLVTWGTGNQQTPGLDFILPYWMARHYGVVSGPSLGGGGGGGGGSCSDQTRICLPETQSDLMQ